MLNNTECVYNRKVDLKNERVPTRVIEISIPQISICYFIHSLVLFRHVSIQTSPLLKVIQPRGLSGIKTTTKLLDGPHYGVENNCFASTGHTHQLGHNDKQINEDFFHLYSI